MFGLSNCRLGTTQLTKRKTRCCPECDFVQEAWGLGNVYLGELNNQSAQYIAGYVCKKMTGKSDIRLDGRHPEFARMSLRPGIGADFIPEVASSLMQHEIDTEDVPNVLRHGRSVYPLGRYLKGKLREHLGRAKEVPDSVKSKMDQEMQPMRAYAFANSLRLKDVVKEAYHGQTLQAEKRFALKRKRGSI